MTPLRKLHHNAYRCRDSGETRKFYEDFLGMRLACTLEIEQTMTGRKSCNLHTFYEMAEGAYLRTLEDKLRFLDDQWLQKAATAGIDGKAALSELKSTVNSYRP